MPRYCRILIAALLLYLPAYCQTCSDQGTMTTATTSTPTKNNTTLPICNAWALTWNIGNPKTAITALTIQLEGSDDNVTYAAYSGSNTVIAGTANPTTALSGAIIIQGQTKLAWLRVHVTSLTGTGTVTWKLNGTVGVTPAAKSGGGSGVSVSWTNVTAGTNSQGFLQVHSPTVIEPTATSPGGIYATQIVDANDLPALQIQTPGGPTSSYFLLSTDEGGNPGTITIAPTGSDSNVNLLLASKGTGALVLNTANLNVSGSGAVSVGSGTSINPTGSGTVNANELTGTPISGTQGSSNSLAQLALGATNTGDLLAYDSHGNAVDSGQAAGPGKAYVASASGTSFSVSMATANQGYNPGVTCWSGPVVVNAGVNTVSGAQIVCTPTNDGAGNVGATWTSSGQVQSVSVAGIGATATAASGLTNGCTQVVGAINGPCKVTITAAQLATLSSTVSVQVLPAVTGKTYVFMSVPAAYYKFNTTPYTFTGTFFSWSLAQPGLTLPNVGTDAALFVMNNGINAPLSSDQDFIFTPNGGIGFPGSQNSPSYVGQAINLYLSTDGGMTGGDGMLDIYLTYLLI